MTTKYSDQHTLYVRCGGATCEQIRHCFGVAVGKCTALLGKDVPCQFRVNFVCDKDDKPFDLAFVYVTNPAVYHMLLGRNPDGSERVERIPDASWTPPPEGEYIEGVTVITAPAPVLVNISNSWADIMEEEDRIQAAMEKEKLRRSRPLVTTKLPPLVTIPSFPLQVTEGKSTPPDEFAKPMMGNLTVDCANVQDLDAGHNPKVLMLYKVPNFVTNESLIAQFAPYVNAEPQDRCKYPIVKRHKSNVSITFSPNNRDAQFAMHMMKKFTHSVTINGRTNSCMLFCSFATKK